MLPTTNISTTLVANTLGTSSRDVGTLCTSDRINKWSKYKPTRYSAIAPTMDQFWKANDGYCGFDLTTARISNATDVDGMVNNVWTYLPPRGGEDEPYRLGDFRGYEHNATVQYSARVPGTIYSQADNVIAFGENWSEGTIKFLELLENYGLGTVYIGVALKQDNMWTYASGDLSLGGNVAVNLWVGAQYSTGAAKIYIFLADQPVNEANHQFPSNTIFFCFPDGVQREFNVTIGRKSDTTYVDRYVITQWNYVTTYYNHIDFEFVVKATSSSDNDYVSIGKSSIITSFQLTDEYGQIYSEDEVPATDSGIFYIESITNSSDNKQAIVKGQIRLLDYTTIRSYDGLVVFTWTNGAALRDALGGYPVSFNAYG